MLARSRSAGIPAVLLVSALLGGCGGSGSHVVTSNKPAEPLTTSASVSETTSSVSSAVSSAPAAAANGTGGTPAQGARTETAPAFAHEESTSTALANALAAVRAHGYTPGNSSEYHPEQTLRVLVGTRAGSVDGYDEQAFFFLGERYLGTDSSQASASVHVISQSDTEVTLGYALYRPGDSLCCPSGGEAHVTYQLNNGALAPTETIPPVSERR